MVGQIDVYPQFRWMVRELLMERSPSCTRKRGCPGKHAVMLKPHTKLAFCASERRVDTG